MYRFLVRALVLGSVLCLLVAFVGCNDSTDRKEPTKEGPSQKEPAKNAEPPETGQGHGSGRSESATPNVVLIVVDTLRADRLGMERSGVPLMPFLEAFSKESWNFKNATPQATWTRPSMASLFTSLYAGVHNQQFGVDVKIVEGQDHTVDVLPDAMETMASYFKKAGYATIGIQTNWNMQPTFGVAQGFDRYEMIPTSQNARDVTNLALDILKDAPAPLFFYVHYLDPHAPYEPPEHYRTLFGETPEITDTDRELLTGYASGYYMDKVKWDLGFQKSRPPNELSAAAREYVRILYDGEVRLADDEVARLIENIRASRPDTVIVFSSDHGEELWEHGSVGHGKTVYEEVAHVPLVVSFPNEPPRVINRRVELIDILPTLAAHLGLPRRDWWQGRNLLEEMETEVEHPVFTQTMTSLREANVRLLAVLYKNWKLILDRAGGSHRLYDLEKDPGELAAITNDAEFEAMNRIVETHIQNNRNHPLYASPTISRELDAETEAVLRSQGYL